MKSFRWTLIVGILVVGLAAFAVWDYKRSAKETEQKEKDLAVLRFKPDQMARLELNTKTMKTVLEKKDGKWRLVEPIQDSTDAQALDSFLSALEGEKVTETVIDASTDEKLHDAGEINWQVYGLDQPATSLRIVSTDGKEQVIKIGSVKAYDSNLYARINDEKKVLLVGPAWDTHLTKTPREFRDKRVYRSTDETPIDSIEIVSSGAGQNGRVQLQKTDGKWQSKGSKNPFPLSDELVGSYIEQVKAVRTLDFIEDRDLAKHGLTKPVLVVRLQQGAKPPFELKFAAPKGEEPNVAAVSSDLTPVLSVYKTAMESLNKREEDFFDKKLPFKFQPADVGQVRIKTAKLDVELKKEGNVWVPADKGLQKDVDSGKLEKVVGDLAAMEAVRFLEPIQKGQTPRKLTGESRIVLSKTSGEPVFEFVWGEPIIEKASAGRPESRYHPARTNLAERVIGVPEGSISGLGLDTVLKDKVSASPTPSPTTAPPKK